MISAKMIADSIGPGAARISSLELTYPRFIHSEVMTHKALSKSASSSRATPVKVMLDKIRKEPACPVFWGQNQKGMQAAQELTGWRLAAAQRLFLLARWPALFFAWLLLKIGLHKQLTNRITEPWSHITILITGEFDNLLALRTDKNAQPEFRVLAEAILEQLNLSRPKVLREGQWHLPYFDGDLITTQSRQFDTVEDIPLPLTQSAANCARLSYKNLETGKPATTEENLGLFRKLFGSSPIHASPAEHQARVTPGSGKSLSGNLPSGWEQFRKRLPGENIPRFRRLRHYEVLKNGTLWWSELIAIGRNP